MTELNLGIQTQVDLRALLPFGPLEVNPQGGLLLLYHHPDFITLKLLWICFVTFFFCVLCMVRVRSSNLVLKGKPPVKGGGPGKQPGGSSESAEQPPPVPPQPEEGGRSLQTKVVHFA